MDEKMRGAEHGVLQWIYGFSRSLCLRFTIKRNIAEISHQVRCAPHWSRSTNQTSHLDDGYRYWPIRVWNWSGGSSTVQNSISHLSKSVFNFSSEILNYLPPIDLSSFSDPSNSTFQNWDSCFDYFMLRRFLRSNSNQINRYQDKTMINPFVNRRDAIHDL
jgi:hypothetical protein